MNPVLTRWDDAVAAAGVERVGRVTSVVGLGAEIEGVRAAIGDVVVIGEAPGVHAEVVATTADRVRVMPYGPLTGVAAGAPFRRPPTSARRVADGCATLERRLSAPC